MQYGAAWGLALVAVFAIGCSGAVRDGDGAAPAPMGGNMGGAQAGSSAAGGSGGGGGSLAAAESLARRVSRAELDHILRDLLGDESAAASELLPEDPYSPYDNDYTEQTVSAALIDSYALLADDVATRVVADETLRDRLLPCEPDGPGDQACFRQTAAELTRRAFRRELSDQELVPYLELLDYASEESPHVETGFDTALELLLTAVLMDPELLYRIEVGEETSDERIRALTGEEIATRMSFLLWGTIPDDVLLAAAEAGDLQRADGRGAAFERMWNDPRAREQLHRFHAMWLGYRVIPHTPELAAAFDRETTALLDRIVFEEPAPYTSLFTFAQTYLDDMLADHYDLPHPTGGSGWVDYGDSGRAGLLSHGSLLSAFGKYSDTSPTQRGILIRTRLLCESIPPPPPDVMADRPPGDMDAVCKYDRYAEHRDSGSSCAACHSQMDPIGFGLERYDLAGRYREHDEGLPQCEIEGRGEVPPYGSFSGPAELGSLLVESGRLERCVVSQLLSFALGRPLSSEEDALVDELTEGFVEADTDLRALLLAYVRSESFVHKREPTP